MSGILKHPFKSGSRIECVAGGVAVGVAVGVAFMKWKACTASADDDEEPSVPPVVFLKDVPSDIDVSQSVTPLPIGVIARRAGITKDELAPYVPTQPALHCAHLPACLPAYTPARLTGRPLPSSTSEAPEKSRRRFVC